MKVLITGGYGFIGSHVVDRFVKEGHKVFIIDNLSTGEKENVKVKHKFYNLNVDDRECEEIFKTNRFDIVIHMAAGMDGQEAIENSYIELKSDLSGTVNMLDLSVKYGVKKFIFASSSEVYGNEDNGILTEESKTNPISAYGVNKRVGEIYCEKWQEIYGLNTICFRLSNVYGPRQNETGESSVISKFFKNAINDKPITVFGDGMKARDFIYVEDVAYAIFSSCNCDECSGIYNLSSNTEKTINEVVDNIKMLHEINNVIYKEQESKEFENLKLDNTKVSEALKWKPKFSFEEGVKETYDWYLQNNRNNENHGRIPKINKMDKLRHNKILPYVENLVVFLIILMLNIQFTNLENFHINMMYNMAYILIFAVTYGQMQATVSSLFSVVIYLNIFLRLGGNFVNIVYNPGNLIDLALYILVATITGYSIEKRNNIIYSKNLQVNDLTEKNEFLQELYNENRIVKEELQKQIINKRDSFSQIYKTVSVLGTLNYENIFTEAINVIEEIMESPMVAIYSLNDKKDFLRLKSRSNNSRYNISSSIRIDSNSEFKTFLDSEEIYINRKFEKGKPILAAPLLDQNEIICYIAIYEMNFENLTLYYINLFKTLISLISAHLIRAGEYEKQINEKKYIDSTMIMKESYFKEFLDNIRDRSERYEMKYSILFINNYSGYNIEYINDKIATIVRNDDYMGINNGKLNLILNNTGCEEAEIVIDKLKKQGIEAEIAGGECKI